MKAYVIIAALAMAVSAQAGTSYSTAEVGVPRPYDQYPRVKIYGSDRNAIGANGEILVCPMAMKITYDDKCYPPARGDGTNAWTYPEADAPIGFKVAAYEYRFVGSGYRNLIVYYSKVR